MPIPIVAESFFSFLAGLAGRFFTDTALKFVATKVLLVTLLTVTLPVVLKNLMTWLFQTISDVASGSIDSEGMSSVVISLSGYAGYLGSHLMLVDCVAIILLGVVIRATLNMIPFIG